jgi:hypothetical protein
VGLPVCFFEKLSDLWGIAVKTTIF